MGSGESAFGGVRCKDWVPCGRLKSTFGTKNAQCLKIDVPRLGPNDTAPHAVRGFHAGPTGIAWLVPCGREEWCGQLTGWYLSLLADHLIRKLPIARGLEAAGCRWAWAAQSLGRPSLARIAMEHRGTSLKRDGDKRCLHTNLTGRPEYPHRRAVFVLLIFLFSCPVADLSKPLRMHCFSMGKGLALEI